MKYLTSGESHGKCLNAIIEGLPSGFEIKEEFINDELKKRQIGYGRGGRMQIESDTVEIKSGVRFGKTTGSPICLEIKNRDFENWLNVMSINPVDLNNEEIRNKIAEKILQGLTEVEKKDWTPEKLYTAAKEKRALQFYIASKEENEAGGKEEHSRGG